MRAGGAIRTRAQLTQAIYGDDAYRDPRNIDLHVHNIREKLRAAGGDPAVLVTVRGTRLPAGAMTGLRGRMIAALVVTSLATLAAAALVFAPLLEQRLENDRLHELRGLIRTTAARRCARRRSTDRDAAARRRRPPRAPGGRPHRDPTTSAGARSPTPRPSPRTPAPGLADLRSERAEALRQPGRIVLGHARAHRLRGDGRPRERRPPHAGHRQAPRRHARRGGRSCARALPVSAGRRARGRGDPRASC